MRSPNGAAAGTALRDRRARAGAGSLRRSIGSGRARHVSFGLLDTRDRAGVEQPPCDRTRDCGPERAKVTIDRGEADPALDPGGAPLLDNPRCQIAELLVEVFGEAGPEPGGGTGTATQVGPDPRLVNLINEAGECVRLCESPILHRVFPELRARENVPGSLARPVGGNDGAPPDRYPLPPAILGVESHRAAWLDPEQKPLHSGIANLKRLFGRLKRFDQVGADYGLHPGFPL